jgi:tetratricopeptide (TPR) repeat protein
MLGFMHCLDARFGWWDDHETAMGKARAYSDKALEIDPDNADAHTASSLILLMQRRYDEAVADARRRFNSRLARHWQQTLPASFSRRPDIPKRRSSRARKRLPLARTILRRIWARSETPIAWRGEPSKRSPPLRPTMPAAPDLALLIL